MTHEELSREARLARLEEAKYRLLDIKARGGCSLKELAEAIEKVGPTLLKEARSKETMGKAKWYSLIGLATGGGAAVGSGLGVAGGLLAVFGGAVSGALPLAVIAGGGVWLVRRADRTKYVPLDERTAAEIDEALEVINHNIGVLTRVGDKPGD